MCLCKCKCKLPAHVLCTEIIPYHNVKLISTNLNKYAQVLIRARNLNPSRGKRIFSSHKRPHQLQCPPTLLLSGYWGSFIGVKQLRDEVNHSLLSSATPSWCREKTFLLYTAIICSSGIYFQHHYHQHQRINYYIQLLLTTRIIHHSQLIWLLSLSISL
jgi:hypothetical protein